MNTRFNTCPFILSIFMFLSQILFSLPERFISSSSSSQSTQTKSEQVLTVPTFHQIQSDYPQSSLTFIHFCLILFITILSVLESNLPVLITLTYNISTDLRYQLKIVDIFFIAGLAWFILSTPLYRHQYISLGFIGIGLCGVLYVTIDYSYDFIGKWYWLVCLIVIYGVYGLQTTFEKWLMHNRFFSPYRLLFYEGTIGLSIMIIVEVLLGIYMTNIEDPLQFIRDMDYRMVIYIIMYVIIIGSVCLCGLLTNKHFGPTHLAMSDTITSMVHWAITFALNSYNSSSYPFSFMSLFGYIMIIFGAFVYNEIIIISLWNIGYYTKVAIEQRAKGNVKETMDVDSMNLDPTMMDILTKDKDKDKDQDQIDQVDQVELYYRISLDLSQL